MKASHLTQRCVGILPVPISLFLKNLSAGVLFGTTCQHPLCLNGLHMSIHEAAEAPMTTRKVTPKYLRMHLHLDENTARQVRLQAHRWGLNETQTVKQLIRLGLDARSDQGNEPLSEDAVNRVVSRAIKPLRDAAIEALFLNRVVVADRRPAMLEEARNLARQTIRSLEKQASAGTDDSEH